MRLGYLGRDCRSRLPVDTRQPPFSDQAASQCVHVDRPQERAALHEIFG